MQNVNFDHIFRQHYAPMVRWAASYIQNADDAEDLVLDAMMYFWEHREQLPDDTNIPAYILTTLKHKCLNYLQHRTLADEVHESMRETMQRDMELRSFMLSSCDPQELYCEDIQRIVHHTLNRLPDKTKKVFTMSRNQHLSHAQIAERLEITTKTVEFHITKALAALSLALKDYLPILLGILGLQMLYI